MKSEVYRLSFVNVPRMCLCITMLLSDRIDLLVPDGTLRWKAPELMRGAQVLTPEMDVYAFAICCVEILTNGALPWPLMDDDAVRHLVLSKCLCILALRVDLTLLPTTLTHDQTRI
jgi:serine/threonine protein kinase